MDIDWVAVLAGVGVVLGAIGTLMNALDKRKDTALSGYESFCRTLLPEIKHLKESIKAKNEQIRDLEIRLAVLEESANRKDEEISRLRARITKLEEERADLMGELKIAQSVAKDA